MLYNPCMAITPTHYQVQFYSYYKIVTHSIAKLIQKFRLIQLKINKKYAKNTFFKKKPAYFFIMGKTLNSYS